MDAGVEDQPWNDVAIDVRIIVSSDSLPEASQLVIEALQSATKPGSGILAWSVQDAKFIAQD